VCGVTTSCVVQLEVRSSGDPQRCFRPVDIRFCFAYLVPVVSSDSSFGLVGGGEDVVTGAGTGDDLRATALVHNRPDIAAVALVDELADNVGDLCAG
jgi:hypothetical protein